MSQIQALFEWLLDNAGRLPTAVVCEWREPGAILDIRFYNCIGGRTVISRQLINGLSSREYVYAINSECTAAEILPSLKSDAIFYSIMLPKDHGLFWKQSVDLCHTLPLYLDQLLSRMDTCDEMCRNARKTTIYNLYNEIRMMIKVKLTSFLGEDRFTKKAAA